MTTDIEVKLICELLRGRGIRSEYALHQLYGFSAPNITLDELTTRCKQLGIPIIVIVKTHLLRESDSVKVRYTLQELDNDAVVPVEDLCDHVLARANGSPLPPPASAAGMTISAPNSDTPTEKQIGLCVETIFTDRVFNRERKSIKERTYYERKVQAYFETFLKMPEVYVSSSTVAAPSAVTAGSAADPRVYMLVSDAPYSAIRQFCALLDVSDATAVEQHLNASASKKYLKTIQAQLQLRQDEDYAGMVGVFSIPDEKCDFVYLPLQALAAANATTPGGVGRQRSNTHTKQAPHVKRK